MESNHVVHAPYPGMSPLSSVRMRKFQSDEGKEKFDPRCQIAVYTALNIGSGDELKAEYSLNATRLS